jgi:hypothetical protein
MYLFHKKWKIIIIVGYLKRNDDLLSFELMPVPVEFVINKSQLNLGSTIIRNNTSINQNVGSVSRCFQACIFSKMQRMYEKYEVQL